MMGFSRYTVSINTKMTVIHSMQIRIIAAKKEMLTWKRIEVCRYGKEKTANRRI